ncbi:hypothetical protein F8388_005134 [Cannabis sativa]|uniref:Uncharacterized protein n=1 Tax=Cannabis sativa TaxID=3483 RepID=A0A7J6DRW8_CANSA|nr:hypothetical protein F8388_005134 [Cannabis sativa]
MASIHVSCIHHRDFHKEFQRITRLYLVNAYVINMFLSDPALKDSDKLILLGTDKNLIATGRICSHSHIVHGDISEGLRIPSHRKPST